MDADIVDQLPVLDESAAETSAETVESALEQSVRLAVFRGEVFSNLPDDLYIPPEALEIFLEAFEGPLDLLLYLIKRNNMDILEMPVADITRQYMDYVELMRASQFELAAEYLVMAATLAEIKSRMLLPRQTQMDDEEEDPRAELIRRLQEYECFKIAAENLDSLPRQERDFYPAGAELPTLKVQTIHPDVDLREVLLALSEVLGRADLFEDHHIEREALSTRERMAMVLNQLRSDGFTPFVALFTVSEGRLGVVVAFLAILELIKESLVELVQAEPFGPIHVKARTE